MMFKRVTSESQRSMHPGVETSLLNFIDFTIQLYYLLGKTMAFK